jgi:cytochrome P450
MNPLITTFRTLTQDYSFDEKYHFKKGTQFLILNNPVLREKEFFEDPNKFNPERWTKEMESSYYSISFNQGPQRCPAKELVIFLAQSFIYNFFSIHDPKKIKVKKMNITDVQQIMNPCTVKINVN